MNKKKLLKVLIIILIVLVVILVALNSFDKYTTRANDITNRIGKKVSYNNVTVNEYVMLSERTLGVYLKYLSENRFEDAYKLLTPEYREFVSLDEFQQYISEIDLSSYQVKSVIHKTENMYVIQVETGDGMNHDILVILNNNSFAIVPEPFLKYVPVEKSISKNGITYELIGYQINLNSCIFDINITNHKGARVNISDCIMRISSGYEISASNGKFIVESGDSINASIMFPTSLDYPTEFEIDRTDGTKVRMYQFKLD